jgi:hypothetical protein
MTAFRDAVDLFLATPKSATGEPTWRPSRDRTGISTFWLIVTATGTTEHGLHVVAYLTKPYAAFTVMVEFRWQEREFPVIRLNIDSEVHSHINHPARPAGIEPRVLGNRLYSWAVNRNRFRPFEMVGLPYCLAERTRCLSMPSAIRKVAAEAAIDFANVDVPDYPPRLNLI